jgi:phosphoribosylformylglycinamidine synthase
MWQFSQVIDGVGEACATLGTPITGGNVSFYNETLGKSIYPTPVIGVLGILDDASRVLKIAFRKEGDIILLLDGVDATVGARYIAPCRENATREFSSSEYSKTVGGIVAGEPPSIDLTAEKRLIDCLVALAAEGSIQSAHDVSDGGLAVTLAESCFARNGLGATAKLEENGPAEAALFGERGARAVVSVTPAHLARVLDTAREYQVAAHDIGKVIRGDAFCIQYEGSSVIDSSIPVLHGAWARSLERTLKMQ